MFRNRLFVALWLAVAGCGQGTAQVVGGGPMTPIAGAPVATTLTGQLQAAGLDVHALPPLDALSPTQLKAVMKSFTAALGVSCTGCHKQGDFAAPTPEKNVARHMWSDFTARLALADGSPIYCDSCHQGKAAFLDRSDQQALERWMKSAFVDGLQRRDGQPHTCTTCHGDPFDPMFLAGWEKG